MFGHYYDKSTTDNELLDKDHFLHLSIESYHVWLDLNNDNLRILINSMFADL